MAPVKISDRPNTFAGFDIVLAISEEAVNIQFQKLYNTRITEGRMIPRSKFKLFADVPVSEHLINHRLSLRTVNVLESTPEKPVLRDEFLDSCIECPKIRFRPQEYDSMKGDAGDVADKYKKAYLEIKFKRDENRGVDSTMNYYDKDRGKIVPFSLNGYTMVWRVKIGRRDVESVMEGRTLHYYCSEVYSMSV
jgi:hypothetical protein